MIIKSPQTLTSGFLWGIGFLIFLPSTSIANIGNSTSIQPAVLLAIAFLFYEAINKKLTLQKSYLFWLFSLIAIIMVQLVWMSFSSKTDLYFKSITFFSLSILMLFVGNCIAFREEWESTFLAGYLAGALFSSFWAIAQWLSWNVLGSESAYLYLFHNSISFPTVNVSDSLATGRAIGITSEPAVLFSLLAPAICISILSKQKVYTTAFIILSAMATQSFGIILVLPLSTLLIFYYSGIIKIKTLLIILIMAFGGTYWYIDSVLSSAASSELAYSSSIADRVVNLESSASLISRANSIVQGVEMFLEKPILGWGIQSDALQSRLIASSTFAEQNPGIDSWGLLMLVGLGLPFTLILLLPLLSSFNRETAAQKNINIFIVSTVIASVLMLSYYNLYSVWLALGIASRRFFSDKYSID